MLLLSLKASRGRGVWPKLPVGPLKRRKCGAKMNSDRSAIFILAPSDEFPPDGEKRGRNAESLYTVRFLMRDLL